MSKAVCLLAAVLCLLMGGATFAQNLTFEEELFSTQQDDLRVGIEVEFRNLTLERAAQLVATALNGSIKFIDYSDVIYVKDLVTGEVVETPIALRKAVIFDSDVGELIIKPEENGTDMIESEESRKKRILELVTDPLTLDKVHHIQKALDALVLSGAHGTDSGAAVSLQVSVEVGRGNKDMIDPLHLVELIRLYSDSKTKQRVLSVLNPPERRRPYIQDFSPGLLARINNPNYRPTQRQLFDDMMYRQMLELMGDGQAWTKSLKSVKAEILKHLEIEMKKDKNFGEAFFRVIKFSRIKIASIMIFLFPEDPLSKIILTTGWIHPIPAVEFRERNNDFNVLEAARMSVGFVNKAHMKSHCATLLR